MFNLINYSNITVCTATGVNIVINSFFFNKVKLSYTLLCFWCWSFVSSGNFFKWSWFKVKFKDFNPANIFSYIRTSNSLNQACLRPSCHRNNNQNH